MIMIFMIMMISFYWKQGGDGDNGEALMYELDAFFELLDIENNIVKWVGPGSLTCDKAGASGIEDCKDCYGTGSCNYGKEEG